MAEPITAIIAVAEAVKASIELAKINIENHTPQQRERLAEVHLTFMEWAVKDMRSWRKLLKLDDEAKPNG